jgi:phage gpG-like protein
MIDIKFKLSPESIKYLTELPKDFYKGLVQGMRNAMFYVEKEAKSSFGIAGNLKVGTGLLRRSIHTTVKPEGSSVTGTIGSDVVYARIHEYGGTIVPRTAKWLQFKVNGQWVRTDKVTIPARPFLTPAITKNQEKIKDIIQLAIEKEVPK